MNDKLTLFDGRNLTDLLTGTVKSFDLDQYPDDAWEWLSGKPGGEIPGLREYYRAIPFLFRGVDMRASRVSSMPFGIFRGETEIDSSDDYQNEVGFLPNPKRLFALIEMSLTLLGRAYLFNVRNEVITKGLKYLNPTTIQPDIKDPEGLVGFKRTTTRGSIDLDLEEVIYFWPGDPWVEIGQPFASPGTASLMAAGVLSNVDQFIAAFFGRGAIKQTIWRVEGMPQSDRDEFIERWKAFSTGIKNAFKAILFNAERMEPIVVGEGLEGLQDNDLTRERKEDIAHALGIPVNMLFTNAANYNTADKDVFRLYDETITPETEFIFSILNEQVFEPMGLRIKDKHESLDVYQKDEQVRSTAFSQYVGVGMPLDFTFLMLGLEVPEGHSIDELVQAEEDKKAAAVAGAQQIKETEEAKREREMSEGKSVGLLPSDNQTGDGYLVHPLAAEEIYNHSLSSGAKADLAKWERKALRLMVTGKSPVFKFESEHLSDTQRATIIEHLVFASTPGAVKAAFADIWAGTQYDTQTEATTIHDLTAALQGATMALRETA